VRLIEHRDRELRKEELMALLWPTSTADPNNLGQQINALRDILNVPGDRQHFIKTIPKRGHRFFENA
jgi:DNA-binding winged helix-turn-helix (wHTH) protein